jgi:hypothetical protein
MWQFGFPSLIWGFLLVLSPLVIHLINLLRHRRVKWAAMDFLLQSYKKHRKWVWLRQMLLLASRMAAVALLVAMLAQWKPQSSLFARFSGDAAHHYVLLDDSFSMTERIGGAAAFDHGLQALRSISQRALEQDGPQRFTLIRFSKATGLAPEEIPDGTESAEALEQTAAQVADLNAAVVDGRFDQQLEEQRRRLSPSELTVGPIAALQLAGQLVEADDFGARIVYVISDFRAKEWSQPSELRSALSALQSSGAEIELIGCVRQPQDNLAVVGLQPDAGPRVAGVPLFMNVQVKNLGKIAAKNVQLRIRTRYFDAEQSAAAAPGQDLGVEEELPIELLESIGAGETVTRRVQVFFPKPGRHVVEAQLPEDVVEVDNRRWSVIDFRAGEPVLIVDGDPAQRNAFYLESIFQPGPRAKTGIEPRVAGAEYLRDAAAEDLAQYSVIYLMDIDRLDSRAVEKLETFVNAGGGLAFFMGPRCDAKYFNETLYREGNGVFPLPLGEQDLLPPEDDQPDINVEGSDHPLFRDLMAERNPIIRHVHVDRYFSPLSGWKPAEEERISVIAALRNQAPLIVEKPMGEGRVIAVLTTYAPLWNDLALGPNALIALQMQAYLAQGLRQGDERLVGSPLHIEVNLREFQNNVIFVAPGNTKDSRMMIERGAAGGPTGDNATVSLGTRLSRLGLGGETDRSGVYDALLRSLVGSTTVRRYALNVDTNESDLSVTEPKTLTTSLDPVRPTWRYADESQFESLNPANLPPNLLLMLLLVVLLLAEQALAYATSYHPAPGGARL